jgi:hypothetical protein
MQSLSKSLKVKFMILILLFNYGFGLNLENNVFSTSLNENYEKTDDKAKFHVKKGIKKTFKFDS